MVQNHARFDENCVFANLFEIEATTKIDNDL